MDVTPGEPVPPGFEDEMNNVAEIQKIVQSYKGNALIGLEYAIELQESGKDREPFYMCVLCDKRCDPRTIMQHWTSHGHRLEYLDKHFPTAMQELEIIRNKPDKMKVMIQALSEAIERHHGRGQLVVYTVDEFRRSKSKIFDEVKAKFHYDERNGPNFVNVIDRSLLNATGYNKGDKGDKGDKSGKTEELDEISSDSDAGLVAAKKLRQQGKAPTIRLLSSSKRNDAAQSGATAAASDQQESEKQNIKFPTPKELSLQASHIAQERYKWEKYRCMLEIYLKQMEKAHKDYEKNPEKHPLYPEEWKAFWNRRYKELQKEKKVDPNKYDYRPEWALYWAKRRKELFDAEIEKKKKEIKAKLELPEDAEEVLDRLKEKYKIQTTRPAVIESNGADAESKNGSKRDATVIDISDDDQPPSKSPRSSNSRSKPRSSRVSRSISPRPRGGDHRRPTRRRSKSRSMSPFSDEYDQYEGRQVMRGKPPIPHGRGMPVASLSSFSSRRYPPVEMSYRQEVPIPYYKHSHYSAHYRGGKEVFPMHSQYDDLMESPPPAKQKKDVEPEPEEEGPLTVVAVLRLLTALEDILGSLGPKTVDLLGKALALDNVKANSADDLLLNEDNSVFFETAKEKLKGLLIAGMVEDPQKVRAVKKAIRNIAAIIHQVSARGKNADKKEETAVAKVSNADVSKGGSVNRVVNIKELPFDRQLVASKLAAELVKQGREDLSTADMDKLIYFFILMVKLSKNKFEIDEKPLYLKDIAKELEIKVLAPIAPAPALAPVVEPLSFKASTSNFPARPNRNNFASFVENLLEEEARDNEVSNDRSEKSTKNDGGGSSSLESLTDSDLQTLLQNFKHLSSEEQHHLIAHLKKLETSDPTRVEKLRKFVNVADETEALEETNHSDRSSLHRGRNDASASSATSNKFSNNRQRQEHSPHRSNERDRANSGFSEDEFDAADHRERGSKVVNPNRFSLDDEDDDDYNFDDVLKAASNMVDNSTRHTASKSKAAVDPPAPGTSSKDALTFNRAALNSTSKISLSETQNLIANLMGNIQQSNSSKKPNAPEQPQSQQVQSVQSIAPFYQSYNQQQQRPQAQPQQQAYPQQAYPQNFPQQQQQQQQPPQPQPSQAPYGANNQMGYNQMGGYMGNDPNAYYGYNNAYPGYPQQPQQQWSGGYNMYGGN